MLERGQFPGVTSPQPSDTKVIDLDRILSMLRRQLRVMALCIGIGLGLAAVYLALAPRAYVSASQILIDKNLEQVVSDVAIPTSALDVESEILNRIEVLKSSRIAMGVAAAQNLTTDQEFLNPPPSFTGRIRGALGQILSIVTGPPEEAPAAQSASIDEVVGALRSNVIVERIGRSSVLRVGYEASSPELAQRIAQAYANVLVQDQLNADLDATRQATDWLQQRLAELGESQRAATLAVDQYRRDAGLSIGQDQVLTDQRLEALTAQLVLAQAETGRVQSLSDRLGAVIAAGPEVGAENVGLLTGPGFDEAEIAEIRSRYAAIVRRIAEINSAFGPDHPQIAVLNAEKAAITGQIFAQLQGLNEQYRNQLSIAQSQENGLRESIDREGRIASDANQSQVELTELQQRSDTLGILYNSFLSRYEELVQRQSFPIPSARIITEAIMPGGPDSPRTIFVLAGSIIFGMFLGLGAGAINELRERSFRSGGQISQELGIHFLGYLPQLKVGGSSRAKAQSSAQIHKFIKDQVVDRSSNLPTTAFLETLKTGKIMLRSRHHAGRGVTVGVVSVLPGEGKTTYAVAFAEMLAASGSKVLLIDADLRQPAASRLVAANAKLGLMDLSDGHSWREIVLTDPDTGLVIMPATSSANASTSNDFLASPAMQTLLEDAQGDFDYIVIDLPPLGPVVDAKSILPWTDGFILVAEWGRTPRRLVRALLENDPQLSEEIIGVVLNKVDFSKLALYSDPGGVERFVGSYGSAYNTMAPTQS